MVCGERALKRDLLRLTLKAGKVELGVNEHREGRGAYVHKEGGCAFGLLACKRLRKALKISGDYQLSEGVLKVLGK